MSNFGSAVRQVVRPLVAMLVGCALLTACGAGGGASNGGGGFAGIEGTGIVSGFGSVYVNGIEFATDNATFVFNGAPASEARLRVGDVVTVFGRIDGNGNARADRIVFDRIVDGPITTIETDDNGDGQLTALGQTVRFDADTTFVDTSADALQAGDLIAISGLPDSNGALRASSIERGGSYQPGTSRIDVEGTVQALDASTFRIGALSVRYDAATVDTGAGTLGDGAYVQVFGTQSGQPQAPLNADSVIVRARALGEDGEQVFVEGVIARFGGLADFEVNGQRVDASRAQRTDNAVLAPANGVSVSVRGKRQGDILVADTLSVRPPPTVTLRARLGNVETQSGEVNLLGTQWTVKPDTLYVDASADAGADRRLRVDRLAAGDTVSVNGYMSRDGLIMTRLERVAADAEGTARVRGPIDSISRAQGSARIVVAGAEIVTRDATTQFRNAAGETIDAQTFFASAAAGTTIDALGPDNSDQIDTARSVQLTE